MRSGCDQPQIRHTTGRFPPFEGDIINEFLGSSAAVVSGGLGFNSRIAVFVFLFLFGFCVFLFLFWVTMELYTPKMTKMTSFFFKYTI